jgi:hypothetical protein
MEMVPRKSDPGECIADRFFKVLVKNHPIEFIEAFVQELLSERGRPFSAAVLPQESALPDLAEPSQFVYVAILATWADGSKVVILLVVNWDQVWTVDLRRVFWHVADLALRHPLAVVYPVVLVMEPGTQAIPDRWEMTVAGMTTVALHVRVCDVTAVNLARHRELQLQKVDAVVACMEQYARSPGPSVDVERFLPLAMKIAKLPESDMPLVRRRLKEIGVNTGA